MGGAGTRDPPTRPCTLFLETLSPLGWIVSKASLQSQSGHHAQGRLALPGSQLPGCCEVPCGIGVTLLRHRPELGWGRGHLPVVSHTLFPRASGKVWVPAEEVWTKQ